MASLNVELYCRKILYSLPLIAALEYILFRFSVAVPMLYGHPKFCNALADSITGTYERDDNLSVFGFYRLQLESWRG